MAGDTEVETSVPQGVREGGTSWPGSDWLEEKDSDEAGEGGPSRGQQGTSCLHHWQGGGKREITNRSYLTQERRDSNWTSIPA